MLIYRKKTTPQVKEVPHELPHIITVQDTLIDESGTVQHLLVDKPTDGFLTCLDARNFELDIVVASGATASLKQVGYAEQQALDAMDAVDSHLAYTDHLSNGNS